MSTFQILHISDMHISTNEVFDTSIVLDPFFKRLDEDKINSGLVPEIVVVTGDVACNGDEKEYNLAKKFFDRLLSELSLSSDRLFIVPGNHDLKRTKLKTTLTIQTMGDVNKYLEDQETRDDLLKDLEKYFLFIEKHYKHLRSDHGRLVPFVKNYRAACGKQIGLVGLNSAWLGKKSPFEDKMIIGEYQVANAKKELSGAGNVDITINIFHHPLDYLWEVDRSICMKHFNSTILLTGHFHGDVKSEFRDEEEEIRYHQFKAGGLYIGSESKSPNRFQYITFDWDKNEIRVYFRNFVKGNRKWIKESERGTDGVRSIPLCIRKGDVRDIHPEVTPAIPDSYKNWISMRCEKMDIDKLVDSKDKDLISLTLPEIFIPLYATSPDKKTKRKQKEIEKEQSPVDIETLIAENDYLLISGQAGSGKTTLLKYLAYTIANEENKAGLNGFLPVLVFLRDLPQMKKKPANHISGTGLAEELLSDYFQEAKHGLTIELVKAYCKEKRAIFLIDGLDEIGPELRKTVVESLATLRADYHCNKMVLSGRPHGIDIAVNNQFGEKLVEIDPLNLNQVTLFIEKWYKLDRELQEKGKTPTVMFGEIKDHPNVEELITTPLMLTAACVLYHYDKKLPEQRADLYEKVISNLIHKRFPDPPKVLRFLMELAYEVHTVKQRRPDNDFDASKLGFDKALALRVMETVFEKEKDETEMQHELRLMEEFDKIEQDCGLLRLEGGQYRFWHLTFQEFLMARKIAMFERDHAIVINEKYWDNDWFKEMIELLIGHLSNTANAIALGIVEDKLRSPDLSPFRNWRLACNCLLDIHPSMRGKVVNLAQKCLCSIFEQKREQDPKLLAEVGEILGWLGDSRNLKAFVKIKDGKYDLKELGKVNITPFEICKYPVTNQWYKEFIDAEGYEKSEYWSLHGQEWLKQQQEKFPRYWHERKWKSPNSPVVGICWYEAYAFCRWLTKAQNDKYTYHLPTEQEWQAAAAGKSGREYAWGKGFDKNKCNAFESGIGRTSAVGIFVEGNTQEGITDLSGNVWEWTKTQYNTKNSVNDFKIDKDWDACPVVRGGSWTLEGLICRCANRLMNNPDDRNGTFGFRCARTLKL